MFRFHANIPSTDVQTNDAIQIASSSDLSVAMPPLETVVQPIRDPFLKSVPRTMEIPALTRPIKHVLHCQ